MRAHRFRLVPLLALCLLATACPSKGGGGGGTPDPLAGLTPEYDIQMPGLTGRVELLRDEHGIAHLFCQTDDDCLKAEGYVQAHDRFFEMDFYRHYAEGRLGADLLSAFTSKVRPVDRLYRRMFTDPDTGESVIKGIDAGLDDATRAFIQDFTDGVNAYLADLHTNQKWTEVPAEYQSALLSNGPDIYQGNADPDPWTVDDTLAVARFFTWDLSETFDQDLLGGKLASHLTPTQVADLVPFKAMDPTYVVPNYWGQQPLSRPLKLAPAVQTRLRSAAPILDKTLKQVQDLGPWVHPLGLVPASNNWVVSASQSSTGHPLVADDPHLQLLSPSIWWEVHVDSKSLPGATGSLKFEGTIFPGTPGVIIGHTDHLGWAVTVTGYDVTDDFVETVSGVDKVKINGQDVAVKKTLVKMPNGPGPNDYDMEKICYVPQHGPIISVDGMSDNDLADPSKPCVDPAVGTQAMSVKWTGQQPTYEITAVNQLLHARTVTEAKAALNNFGVGAQNWVVGDTAGHILYYPHAKVPLRAGDLTQHPPYLPVPGDGSADWTGKYIPNADIPQALDPGQGFVVTANNDIEGVTDDGNPLNDKYYLYPTRDLGLRAGRITRLLQKAIADHGNVTPDDMKAIQTDTHWAFAEWIAPYLIQAGKDDPTDVTNLGLQPYLDRLAAWDFSTPTGLDGSDPVSSSPVADATVKANSVATTIFASFFLHAMDRTFGDELKASGVISDDHVPNQQPFQRVLYEILSAPNAALDGYFDDVSTTGVVETRDQILLGALADAVTELKGRLGDNAGDWLWGRLHTSVFPSVFGLLGAPSDPFAMAPVANDGADHTIDVSNYDRSYHSGAGPSMRIVTDVDPAGVLSWQVIPGGEIDLPDSPNLADQLPMWLGDTYVPMAFDLKTALGDAEARQKAGNAGARWSFGPGK